jgi:hypothetical protein
MPKLVARLSLFVRGAAIVEKRKFPDNEEFRAFVTSGLGIPPRWRTTPLQRGSDAAGGDPLAAHAEARLDPVESERSRHP